MSFLYIGCRRTISMKLNRLPFFSILLFASTLFAQNNYSIAFRNGSIRPDANLRQGFLDSFYKKSIRFNEKSMAVVQFHKIPGINAVKQLEAHGVQLLEYVSGNAYTATIKAPLSVFVLVNAGIRSVVELEPMQKMSVQLAGGKLPGWAVKAAGTVDVWISYPKTFLLDEVMEGLKQANAEVISLSFQAYRVLSVRISSSRLQELAAFPFIEYVQLAPYGDQPLNSNSRDLSGANLLNAAIADGGRGLNGEGVVVGVGDNADVQTHLDFAGRLINRAASPAASHGQHVTGTVGGAGTINEQHKGYAPRSTIISQAFSGILSNAKTYVQDHGMVITNNSYGDIVDCDYHGTYDLISRILDQMAFDLPYLENVFASGNSGASTCAPFATGYKTVLGGYQTAKNVLTVGATTDSGMIASFSSRGPVKDGRLKPEITALGNRTVSTWPTNTYASNLGTSMAAPAVSGGLALLYQRYRQLNGGSNPKNALMKAIICNSAADLGNNGPDYSFGYGWLNLVRSVEALEKNWYISGNSTQGSTQSHSINIPANTAKVKVMLYWNDPAASLLSSKALVNDLDLKVVEPSLSVHLPQVLDSGVNHVSSPATTGEDHMNNMEQVVINNPAPGTYTINVAGTAIAQNPSQEYFLVYDIIPVQLQLASPATGEKLSPSTNESNRIKITWDADGLQGTAALEFSADNGATWNTIETGVALDRTIYSWYVPNISTTQALLRITKDGSGENSTVGPFTIMPRPVVTLAPVQCEGYISINWTTVNGATDYEVLLVKDGQMQTVDVTTGSTYTFSGLSKDSTYWVSVMPRIINKSGRRSVAVSRKPETGNCSGNISNNDLKVDAIVSAKWGRKFTSSELSSSYMVSARIENLDDAPASGFNIQYSINGGSWITENVSTPIVARGSYTHNFATTTDLSAPGLYLLTVVVKNTTIDNVTANDTMSIVVKHLDNAPLDLSAYFTEDLETAATGTYQKDTAGLTGIDRFDFAPANGFGRARTFVNSGIAHSGSKAITLDADRYIAAGTSSFLYSTFNLGNYSSAANDIRIDFWFLNHSQVNHSNNKVWARGSDTEPWIEVYDLNTNAANPGLYKKTGSIELSRLLSDSGQLIGSSLQVRWGQFGQYPATDKIFGAGYSFDDIRVYRVINDLQIKSVDVPQVINCGLSNAAEIKISVRNSSASTLMNVPVKYRVNNGAWISEFIPSIEGNDTLQYSFSTKADLSAFNQYTVQAVVDLDSDSFKENDTLTTVVRNSPVVIDFPYLQTFETGDGNWFAEGTNNSWEYGSPSAGKINKAASGARAWKTGLNGNHNNLEFSFLYSPCFDVSGLTNPTLSFSVALDIEDCGATLCDAAWVEYSTDGINWFKLGSYGTGTNWYNKSTSQLWSVFSYTNWHVATAALPTGFNRLRLRFAFRSDPGVTREGIAVDDIHIYDNPNGIYDGITLSTPVTQQVSGNNWNHFLKDGKLIASILPNNQDLGMTAAGAYIFDGPVRNNNRQYYHHRNITIQPATTTLNDSVTLRFYFLDSETDSLLKANNCSDCSNTLSAYELGVSKYTDQDKVFENGTISDNQQGSWKFISQDNVSVVPFDKGYYAEFKVNGFSEFWLSNGGFDKSTPLPVKMLDFTASKAQGTNVSINWTVGAESGVDRYEIEVARGEGQFQANQFIMIGSVASSGYSTSTRNYSFSDIEPGKFGSQYYRLKIIHEDGSFIYSPVRSVSFDAPVLWQVYPNPSNGFYQLVYQADISEMIQVSVYDSKGRLVKHSQKIGNGSTQKMDIDLTNGNYASGIYLLKIKTGNKELSFKLTKL